MTKSSIYQGHACRITVAIMVLALALTTGVANAETPAVIHVEIFIKDNTISLKNHQDIIVAILTTDSFNATDWVNISSVRFEGVPARTSNEVDANRDGKKDLSLHFKSEGSGIQCGESQLVYLTGKTSTVPEQDIVGWGTIIIKECEYIPPSPPGVPEITSFAPPSPVMNNAGESRTFNISVNQTVDMIWYINGNPIQLNVSTTESKYTNISVTPGTWNVTAVAHNVNGTDFQIWDWIVNEAATTTTITSDLPAPSMVGQPYTVSFTVSADAGAPTGIVTVDDGTGASCSAPVVTGSCSMTSTTAGVKTLTATYSGDTNFSGSSGTAMHQVDKADQTITFGVLDNKTYGDPDFNVNAAASSGLAVSFTASEQCTVSVSTVHITGAGNCTITANQSGNANFNPAPDVSQTFSIARRNITVTADAGQTKAYGDADPSLTYKITSGSLVAGDSFTGTITRDAGENVGTYAITQGTLALNSNYDLTYNGATFTITKRSITVTADAKTKVYGDPDPALTYQVTSGNLVTGDSFNGSLTRDAGENVGTYAITQGTLELSSNYDIVYNTANLVIVKKDASVTPDDKTKVYGEPDPALTGTLTGFLDNDSVTATYSRTAGETVAGSPYTISATLSPAGALGNYNITYNTANLTITTATLMISWSNPADITYGTILDGTQLNAKASVDGSFSYTPAAGTVLNAGTGQKLHVDFTPDDTTNYNNASQDVTINVLKADQTITFAKPADKTYGDADFSLSATGGASGNPVTFAASGSCAVSGTSLHITVAGSCTIAASQAGNDDYNAAADVPQTFSINKAPAAITLSDLAHTYNGTPKPATPTTDPAGLAGVSITYNGFSAAPTDAGSYAVIATLMNANYKTSDTTGTLVIIRADQTITFGPLSDRTYGDPSFPVSATASSGLPVSFTASGACTVSGSTVTMTGAGICTITAHQAGDSNYNAAIDIDKSFNIAEPSRISSLADTSAGGGGCGRQVTSKENFSNIERYEYSREVDVHTSQNVTRFNFATLGIVNEIGFTAKTNEGCTTARAELLKGRPSQAASDAPGTGTVYFNAWVGPRGYSESPKVENQYVVFRTPEKENNGSVKLMMYKDSSWIDLRTEKIDADTYKAYASGFGSFAIVEIPETPTETITQPAMAPQAVTNEHAPQKPVNWVLIMILLVLIASVRPIYSRYRQRLSRKR